MTGDRKKTLLICAVLAIATFAAFEGVRNNDFVNYDDNAHVTDNAQVQKGLSLESVRWAFTSFFTGIWHPLTWISHMICYSLFGLNPAGHHLVSVGFHIANVLLLFLILKMMTRALWPSAFVAAVFGLHPIVVESVAWVAERKDVLSGFFALLTIWAYFRYTQKMTLRRYIAVVVLFAAGLLSKPMLVTLPLILILLDYWPIGRFETTRGWTPWGRIRASIADKLPILFMSAASSVIAYLAQAHMGAFLTLPPGLRAGNAIVSYIKYIGKVFYPGSLAVLYPIDTNQLGPLRIVLCLILLLAITVFVIMQRRKRRFLLTGWLWFLGTLVPVIGFVQVGSQSMADRYMYLPGIGIYIMIAWLAGELIVKLKIPRVVPWAICAVVLCVLLGLTRAQAGYWKNSESLYKHTLAATKNNCVIHSNYGIFLANEGRMDEAIEQFEIAVTIYPGWADAHDRLGQALQEKGLDAEAAAEFEKALQLKPDWVGTRNNYAVSLVETGQIDKAIEQFSMVLIADPYNFSALDNLYKVGMDNGKLDEVLKVILTLQAKAPENFELYLKAGLIYGSMGNVNAAIEQLERACRLSDYKEAMPLDLLSQVYAAKKNMTRAIETGQMALDAANKQGDSELAERLKARLELYRKAEGAGQ